MIIGNRELKLFLNKSKCFSIIFPSYKKFVNVAEFVDSLLTHEQRKRIEIKCEERVIDFKTQLLICFEDKYDYEFNEQELKARAEKSFNKYSFLFETGLNPHLIRTILLREIMEVISVGTQCFYIGKIQEAPAFISKGTEKLSGGTTRMADVIQSNIKANYPQLPTIPTNNKTTSFYDQCFGHMYAFAKNIIPKIKTLWYSEFFKKTRGLLEKLNSCEPEFIDKYREKYYQIACSSLNKNKHHLHWIPCISSNYKLLQYVYLHNIVIYSNALLEPIVEQMIECFKKSKAGDFKTLDSQGKEWDFKEQLLYRYCSRYPSFASLEEIKCQVEKTISQCQPLLKCSQNNATVALELLMDELDGALFVPKATHDGNKEMINNLKQSGSLRTSLGVSGAIKRLLKIIDYDKLKIGDKEYDLKTVLMARGRRAGLAQGKRGFNRRLLSIFTKTIYHPKYGRQEDIPTINIQTFLTEIDPCFLYPKGGRIKNFLYNMDNDSDVTKLRKLLFSKGIRSSIRFYTGSPTANH